jgi:hypothetical protein
MTIVLILPAFGSAINGSELDMTFRDRIGLSCHQSENKDIATLKSPNLETHQINHKLDCSNIFQIKKDL